jgi:hypothetical protein
MQPVRASPTQTIERVGLNLIKTIVKIGGSIPDERKAQGQIPRAGQGSGNRSGGRPPTAVEATRLEQQAGSEKADANS